MFEGPILGFTQIHFKYAKATKRKSNKTQKRQNATMTKCNSDKMQVGQNAISPNCRSNKMLMGHIANLTLCKSDIIQMRQDTKETKWETCIFTGKLPMYLKRFKISYLES